MLDYESRYSEYKLIAGVDEAGRGPLAGPVSVAAVIMPMSEMHPEINDSKKLTEQKRELLYEYIIKNAVAYSVELVDNQTIDRINILRATMLGMTNAVKNLKTAPDLVLIDAVKGIETDCRNIPIIKGDALSYNIAAASILAKVTRDRLMCEYGKIYPVYQFPQHKGYATQLHISLLKKYGACAIHRQCFIKDILSPFVQESAASLFDKIK